MRSQLLTPATFRLNSRDHVRERSTIDKAENSFNLPPILRAEGSASDRSRSNPTVVSISVQQLKKTDLPEINRDHDVESGLTTEENRYGPWASLRLFLWYLLSIEVDRYTL